MTNRAKLLLFSHVGNTKSITGAEKLLLLLGRKLSEYFECVMVSPQEGELTKRARYVGLRTVIIDYPALYSMYRPGPELQNQVAEMHSHPALGVIGRVLEKEQPDAVLVNSCVNILPAIAAKSYGLPVIWKITEIIAETPYLEQAIHVIDQYSDRIIGISSATLTGFLTRVPPGKLGLLPPTWNPKDFHPEQWPILRENTRSKLGFKPNHKVVGFISSFLIEEKGLEHFLNMALMLGMINEDVRFLVVGQQLNKDYYKHCKDLVEATGQASKFVFLPYMESVESAYCSMDLVIVPSIVPEGFGLTALEAIISFNPVFAYASGALAEILDTCGFASHLAMTGEVAQLAAKVGELLHLSPESLSSLVQQGQEKAVAAYGPERYDERLRAEVTAWTTARPDRLLLTEGPEGVVITASQQVNEPSSIVPSLSKRKRKVRRRRLSKKSRSVASLRKGRKRKSRLSSRSRHLKKSSGTKSRKKASRR